MDAQRDLIKFLHTYVIAINRIIDQYNQVTKFHLIFQMEMPRSPRLEARVLHPLSTCGCSGTVPRSGPPHWPSSPPPTQRPHPHHTPGTWRPTWASHPRSSSRPTPHRRLRQGPQASSWQQGHQQPLRDSSSRPSGRWRPARLTTNR